MDVCRIDMAYIELLDLAYCGVQDRYNLSPEKANKRTKKKMRKFVTREYLKGESFPKQVMAYMEPSVSDEEFISFLCACHQRVMEEGSRADNHFKRVTKDLPQDARYALEQMLDIGEVPDSFCRVGKDLHFPVESGPGYDLTLVFHNATGVPKNYDMISFQKQAISKGDDEYCLVGEVENWDDETLEPFVLRFTHATAEVRVHPATETVFFDTSWETLWSMMRGVIFKSEIPGEYLNEQEKELLPLFREGIRLSQWQSYREEAPFPLFKELFSQPGYRKAFSLLERVEQARSMRKKVFSIHKVMKELAREKYEPLWRELYRRVEQSQMGYPSRQESADDPGCLPEVREKIQQEMAQHGYEGTYPNFVKMGPMKQLHFAESYGMDYLVGWHKRVAYHIRCEEQFGENSLLISFLYGTHLLKKGESSQDAFTCTFRQKGHRFFGSFSHGIEGKQDIGELKQMVRIATKKSQLKSLTKEEKQSIDLFYVSTWKLFLLIFMVAGGLFASLFTPAMMGMGALLSWLDGMPVVFFEPFWWWIFLFSWIGFGLPMAIIMVFAKRK